MPSERYYAQATDKDVSVFDRDRDHALVAAFVIAREYSAFELASTLSDRLNGIEPAARPSLPPTDVLTEAKHVTSQRGEEYGHPSRNLTMIAAMWTAYLGVLVNGRDVCWMMTMTKASRDRNLRKRDNLVDAAGYARCAERLEEPA